MPQELSLETLATKLDEVHKTANLVKTAMDDDKEHKAEHTEEEKNAQEEEEKKAQEDKEEKKEARKARYNAVKKAMEEDDEEKRDAAILKAMDESEHEEVKDAQDEEKKEEQANVASIINDKKAEFITKILSANKIINPNKLKQIEARVKKANLTSLKKEWSVIAPFIAAIPRPEAKPAQEAEPFIPYFANIATEDIDKAQLNANSPDSAFAQLSTKELLEMA